MRFASKAAWAGGAVLGLAAAASVVTVFATGTFAQDSPKPPFESEADAPPPGRSFQFIDGTVGTFRVETWDDRVLSDEERRTNPTFNPAWEPFGECVRENGTELSPVDGDRLTQVDLNSFIERINSESPRRDENLDLAGKAPADRAVVVQTRPHQRNAAVFLNCAEEWLTLNPQGVYERTGVPNEYFPPRQ